MRMPRSPRLPRFTAAILVGAAVLLLGPATGAAQANPDILVSAEWLADHLDDEGVVILHVAMGEMGGMPTEAVPGSRFLEYHDIAPNIGELRTELAPVDDLVAIFREAGVSNDSRVVVVGDRGHMLARVFMTLDYLGHGDHTSVLDGGIQAWKAMGGDVTSELATAEPGDFDAHVREDMVVSAEWILDRLDDPTVTLIDARPDVEYTGERPGGNGLRGGHIPGAYNLYWEDLTRSEELPTLKDLAEVQARFDESGASMDGVVVNYCLIGMRASYTYMVSRYLGYDVKFYDASWNDWGARQDLPLVEGRDRR